jgi:hypothetical protein
MSVDLTLLFAGMSAVVPLAALVYTVRSTVPRSRGVKASADFGIRKASQSEKNSPYLIDDDWFLEYRLAVANNSKMAIDVRIIRFWINGVSPGRLNPKLDEFITLPVLPHRILPQSDQTWSIEYTLLAEWFHGDQSGHRITAIVTLGDGRKKKVSDRGVDNALFETLVRARKRPDFLEGPEA